MTIFRSTDSVLQAHNNETITVLGAVDPATYDFDDVGPMFRIRFGDGSEAEAFPDEIRER